jgi:hypothetical protein
MIAIGDRLGSFMSARLSSALAAFSFSLVMATPDLPLQISSSWR